MNHTVSLTHHTSQIAAPAILARTGETISLWRRRMRERDELARWTPRDMRDAGMSDADVWNELRKPFWRA